MPLNKTLQNQIDRLFVDYDTPQTPGCALGVILDGEMIHARGYGLADLEQKAPMTPDTVFHLASISKQFTAMCIALLEESGAISLEEDVKRYIPYLPEYGHRLQLKHLVYMTSGLEDFYAISGLIKGMPEDSYFSQDDAVDIIKAANWLKFKPGERWSYDNTAYFLLARIVEQVSGQPFARFAAEHIFSPLGMTNTFVRTDRRMIIPLRANGYARAAFLHSKDVCKAGEDGYLHYNDPLELSGAGQVWSTINDLFRWDQNFYHNILGQKDARLIERITTPGRLNDNTPTQYAYGLVVTQKFGFKIVSHEGGCPGTNAVIYRVPQKRLSFICLANTNEFLNTLFTKHGEGFYEDLAGMISPWDITQSPVRTAPQGKNLEPAPSPHVISAIWRKMAGMYEDPATSHIWEVTLTASGLRVRENFANDFSLLPASQGNAQETKFHSEDDHFHCIFHQDEDSQKDTFTCILVDNPDKGEGNQGRVFQRFLSQPLPEEILAGYEGIYVCQQLKAGYRVIPVEAGIRLQNLNPRHDLLDVVFTTSIKDMFLARYPPLLGWYVIHFQHDEMGKIAAFVFRDEVPGRDNWVFERIDRK
jgi:CubicO group peptidase (beta-lactamase class C family)